MPPTNTVSGCSSWRRKCRMESMRSASSRPHVRTQVSVGLWLCRVISFLAAILGEDTPHKRIHFPCAVTFAAQLPRGPPGLPPQSRMDPTTGRPKSPQPFAHAPGSPSPARSRSPHRQSSPAPPPTRETAVKQHKMKKLEDLEGASFCSFLTIANCANSQLSLDPNDTLVHRHDSYVRRRRAFCYRKRFFHAGDIRV